MNVHQLGQSPIREWTAFIRGIDSVIRANWDALINWWERHAQLQPTGLRGECLLDQALRDIIIMGVIMSGGGSSEVNFLAKKKAVFKIKWQWKLDIVSWEQEGRYRCTKSMAIAPFWFSMEHLWSAIAPFWLSADDIMRSLGLGGLELEWILFYLATKKASCL